MADKPLKAYLVTCPTDEHCDVAFASTERQARAESQIATCLCDSPYIAHRARRAKQFDGKTPEELTPERLVRDHGWWHECSGCYRPVHDFHFEAEEGARVAVADERGEVYCSWACRERSKLADRKRAAAEADSDQISARG